MFANVLRTLLGADAGPNKVIDIKTDTLGNLPAMHRDEGMVLYGPALGQMQSQRIQYEIVLNRPCSENLNGAFSLYRAATQDEAEEKFNAFLHRLPTFVSIAKEMYNINGLQKLCDILLENPSWTIAHLISYFNLTEHVNHSKVSEIIDEPDYATNMTPIQLAIKCGHLEMVKKLLPQCNLNHLDNNMNSIFHYAAPTTKEIINILATKSTENINNLNNEGHTPLHLSCQWDKPDCVKALLAAGADANIQSADSRGPSNNNNTIAVCRELDTRKLATSEMKNGGTPLHWSTSREVLLELILRGCNVNALNFDEKSALHIMVEKKSIECAVALLAHEADVDIVDKDGNTPLHIAIEKKQLPMVQCLIVFGADFDRPNGQGKSPRHMVGKRSQRIVDDNILYILHSVGAKRCPETSSGCPAGCNFTGEYNGLPPEQPESAEGREQIYQVLASTSRSNQTSTSRSNQIKNHLQNNISNFLSNSTSLDSPTLPQEPARPVAERKVVDVSAEEKGRSIMDSILSMFLKKETAPNLIRFDNESETISQDAKTDDQMDGVEEVDGEANEAEPAETVEKKPELGRGRLLCMDGGGIRGLVLAQMLLEIERIAQTPIHHLFDWVAGTSTGGILALELGAGKTMKQCICMYLRMKEQAFVGSRPYASDNLESLLKETLGPNTVMTDIEHPKLMITGVMADRKPVDLHLFRNYKSASDILGIVTPDQNRRYPPPPPEKQLLWKAARATGAAPSYFRAFEHFLDGGLIANNPTLDAMAEIHEYNMALHSVNRKSEIVPLSVVVSLGTGLIPVTELENIDVFRPESLIDMYKLTQGASAIGNLLVDQATAADGRVVDRARAWCSMIGTPYFRFNPQMSEDIAMDEKNDIKLIKMLFEAKAYMYKNRNRVIEMINHVK